ncbi:Juvenile hormone acid O-methyltransferase like protein [Argiope bruennichi]|nr:Juvenile hormone acid O-methyltransferase like protein [Argiope bruennichi]
MSLKLHPKDYTQWHSPIETVIDFFKGKLTELGLNKSDRNEIVMDVGCGPGGTTKEVILPFFSKAEKIIALDAMPDMIDIARQKNAHPQIEYVVADITEWSTVEQWEAKITKVVSIHCFHWVRNQKPGFQNIYRLLVSGGEAAFFFVLEATFYEATEELQNSSKWGQYLKGHDNRIPDSHHYKYDASYYKKLMEEIGFEVLHCEKEEKRDVYPDDESYKNFFSSICVLLPYIPQEHKEDFKNDILKHAIERNGRTNTGLPFHYGKILELKLFGCGKLTKGHIDVTAIKTLM